MSYSSKITYHHNKLNVLYQVMYDNVVNLFA